MSRPRDPSEDARGARRRAAGAARPRATKLLRDIARSLDATPELLADIADLLSGLDALGSPEDVVEMLRPLRLPPLASVLDLGCGKGAASIAVATELGLDVRGIDGFGRFVDIATRKWESHLHRAGSVRGKCRFEAGDLRRLATEDRTQYDVVMFLSVGTLFGSPDETVAELRGRVRTGGYLLLDDAYRRDDGDTDATGAENYATLEETRRMLTRNGDTIAAERLYSQEEVRAANRADLERIAESAEALAARHPERASAYEAYVQAQRDECRILEEVLSCAMWLLRIDR